MPAALGLVECRKSRGCHPCFRIEMIAKDTPTDQCVHDTLEVLALRKPLGLMLQGSDRGTPGRNALSNLFLGWEGFSTKIDRKNRVPTYSNLSTGGPSLPSRNQTIGLTVSLLARALSWPGSARSRLWG